MVAGVLGLVGLFLPWFTPVVVIAGANQRSGPSFHAWNGFRFLIIAPLLLILAAVLWLQAMKGKHNTRSAASGDPVRSLSRQSIIFGVVSLGLMLLSFPILTSTYKFKQGTSTLSWHAASALLKSGGGKLERGTQFGVYLVIVGAVLLIVAGVLGLVVKPSTAVTTASAQPGNGQQPQPTYGQQPQPTYGQQWQSQQSYGPPDTPSPS